MNVFDVITYSTYIRLNIVRRVFIQVVIFVRKNICVILKWQLYLCGACAKLKCVIKLTTKFFNAVEL